MDNNEVEFLEEENLETEVKRVEKVKGAINNWLIRTKVVKNARAADKLMITVAILAFLLTVFIVFKYIL